jgi:hypothetical protein
LELFWKRQQDTEWFRSHPILARDESWLTLHTHFQIPSPKIVFQHLSIEDCQLQYCIPLLFHGDDADSHRRRSFYTCTISSPLCSQSNSWDSRILLCTIDNSRALTETYDTIDAWLVHGLTELQEGRFLTVDPWGRTYDRGFAGRVCGPYIGILAAFKGDEKFVQRALKVNASPVGEGVCMYCKASQHGRYMYTYHGQFASHRSTLVSNTDFIRSGCRMNAWVRLPGFHLSRVLLDWLHLVDLCLTPECSASETCF